jgi:adenylate kinase family enzyme
MSDLLKQWLNEEIGLSENVVDFEQDFANGYLLGELLYRFNQQAQFENFINKPTADAKISNWCLLEPSVRQMNIKFDSKSAYSIMCQQKGSITKLLYQIKMAIGKLEKVAPISLRPAQKGQKQPLCNMPVKTGRAQFDEENSRYFEKSVKMLVENPNDVMLAKNQAKFVGEKERQDSLAATQQADEEAYMQMRKDDLRMQRLYQTQREHDFLQEWQSKGAQEWSINQQISKERESVKARALMKGEAELFNAESRSRSNHTDQMRDGIDAFETNLKATLSKKGAKPLPPAPRGIHGMPENSEELERRLARQMPHAKNLQMEADEYLSNVRTKAAESEVLQQTRNRRRRRFIADQRQSNVEAEHGRLIDFMEQELLKESTSEVVLEEELWKIQQCKAIAVDDREHRELVYEERRAQDKVEALERDSAAHVQTLAVHSEEIQVQLNRHEEVIVARDSAAHQRTILLASEMLAECVDLALYMCHFREVVGKQPQEFDLVAWKEMKSLFVNGLPLNPLPGCSAGEAAQLAVLTPIELENYFQGSGHWDPEQLMILKDEAELKSEMLTPLDDMSPQQEEEDKGSKSKAGKKGKKPAAKKGKSKGKGEEEEPVVVPPSREEQLESLVPVTNFPVGDLVQKIKLLADPLPEPEAPPPVPQSNFAIVLYGSNFVGRSIQANKLAEKWELTVIEVDSLLRSALDVINHPEVAEGHDAEQAAAAEELEVAKADQTAAEEEVRAAQAELAEAQQLAQDEVDNYAKVKEDAIEAAVTDALEANEPEPTPEDVPVPDEEPMQAAIAETQATADAAQQVVDGKLQTVADKMKVVEERTEALRRANVVASCSHETARLGKEAMALLRSGAAVTDVVYAQLATKEICLCDSTEKGWVLSDFPETAKQAKELEKCLIGYDETAHVPVPQDRAAFTLPTTPLPEGILVREDIGKVMAADAKIPSGIKLFIHLDEDKELLLQRNLGRRHDPVTARQLAQGAEVGAEQGALSTVHEYHLLDSVPPEEVVCKDRLIGVEVSDITPDDARKPTVDMSARIAAHGHAKPELLEFLDRFGSLRSVPCGGAPTEDVFEALNAHVEEMDSLRREKEAKAKAAAEAEAARIKAEADAKAGEMKEVEHQVTSAEAHLAEVEARVEDWSQKVEGEEALAAGTEERAEAEAELTAAEAEAAAGEEAIEEAKAALNAHVEKIAAEEVAAAEAIEAAKPPADAPPVVAKILAQTWATAEWQYTGVGTGHSHKPTQAEQEQAAAAASIQARFRGNMTRNATQDQEEPVPDPEETADDGSDAAAASIQARFRGNQTRQGKVIVYMEPSFAAAGASSMVDPADPDPATAESACVPGSVQDMTARLHRERAMMHEHFRQQTAAFAEFIRRPDDKQAELQMFQDSFNSIEQDMRFDDRTKAELHRRCDELALKLWEMVEAREEEALAELQQIRCDGWVPDHVKTIGQIYEHLAQLEVDHAETIKKLLADRAFAAEENGAGKLPNLLPVEEEGGKKKKEEDAAPVLLPYLTTDVSEIYETEEARLAREEADAGAGKKKGKDKKGADDGEFEPDPSDQYPSLAICLHKATQVASTTALVVIGDDVADDGGKGKKKKGGEEEEAPKPKSAIMIETEELEAKQNEILSQRLERLRLVAKSTLDGVRIFGAEVVERMRQAVDARVKSEASCISAIVAVAKQAIEEEVTLPFDLRVTPEEVYR